MAVSGNRGSGNCAVKMKLLLLFVSGVLAAGFMEVATDSLQLLGEMAPNQARGLTLLEGVMSLRRRENDLRGQIKTLSDMCRLHSGLEQTDEAWNRYREALLVLKGYAEQLEANPNAEDIRGSFITTLKSFVAVRTNLPYLARFATLDRLVLVPVPSWFEKEG